MTEISATLVKTLREKTGAGVMACRTTLAETGGDLDAAIERLRDAQTTMAAKKADREATEGLVALAVEGRRGAIVEVNCETDFVARGEDFRRAVASLGPAALAVGGNLAALLATPSWPRCRSGKSSAAPARGRRPCRCAAAVECRAAPWPRPATQS